MQSLTYFEPLRQYLSNGLLLFGFFAVSAGMVLGIVLCIKGILILKDLDDPKRVSKATKRLVIGFMLMSSSIIAVAARDFIFGTGGQALASWTQKWQGFQGI